MAKNNDLQMSLLNTNVDFFIGTGVGMFRKTILDGKTKMQPLEDPAIQTWLDKNQADDVMNMLATDFFYTGNWFQEGMLQGDRTVSSVKHQHPTDCRAKVINAHTGRTEHYYVKDFAGRKSKFDVDAPIDPKRSTVK